jgi:hypothetical protein
VDLNGTTLTFPSETIEFSGLVNGSYNFTVRMTYGYSASPSSGTITVRGANVDQAIAFSAEAPTYSATFTRSGLPTGTNWSVTVDDVEQSSTTSAIVFAGLLTNGTWPYELGAVVGFVATPSSGTLNVAGANVTQPIVFAPIRTTYPVTFTETGLPSGTNWSVRVDLITEYSTTPSIVFQEPNGTYLYTSNPSGAFYAQSDASGVLTVHGAAGSVSVPYAYSYVLTFTETGLPTELIWSVNVTGTGSLFWENDSFGSTLTFHLPNGTYEYTVTVPHGYSVSPSSGSATIQGAPVPVALVTVSPTSTTSSSFPWILVIVGVVVIAVLIAVVAIWVRRRGRSGPAGGRGATPGPGQPGRP